MRARLSVGADGEIALPQAGAAALGLAEGAEVDVVAARGGFALMTPATDGGSEAWFAGSLASLTVPEVIQFIFTTIKSGTLTLAFGADARRVAEEGAGGRPHRRTLFFRDGQVVFAASSDPADRLGAVLWRQGLVSEEDLERCGKVIRPGRPLGQVLVDEKILTSGQLYEAITIQVKEIVLASCLELEGEFAFVEGPFDESNSVKLDERTRDLLLQGMKRVEEAEQLAARIGGRGSILVRGAADAEGLEGPEGRLIEQADGRRTVSELASATGLGLYETLRLAVPLVEAGALAVGEAEPPSPPEPSEEEDVGVDIAIDVEPPAPAPKAPRASGPFETYRRIFQHVHATLSKHQPDSLSRLNSYFDRLPAKQRQLFEGVRLDEDGAMDVSIIVMNASAGGARAPIAKARSLEALEAFLSFALFEVKNRMPKPAAEALLREVGRMQVGKA
ncbi:MAG TPA: DUF4388 domain-containing protein [Anaeromyxobacteraceae bacterium]|nr:DUF4388 domain-containing protein [Anaeromyxobacteraceae bacterium]